MVADLCIYPINNLMDLEVWWIKKAHKNLSSCYTWIIVSFCSLGHYFGKRKYLVFYWTSHSWNLAVRTAHWRVSLYYLCKFLVFDYNNFTPGQIWEGTMNFGNFSYLAYMLIFTIPPISFIWIKHFKILKKNIKTIFSLMSIGLVLALISDPIANWTDSWFFTKEKILGIYVINFPIEDIIFVLLVSFAISSAIIGFVYSKEKVKFLK